jgi:hypothetical protein
MMSFIGCSRWTEHEISARFFVLVFQKDLRVEGKRPFAPSAR